MKREKEYFRLPDGRIFSSTELNESYFAALEKRPGLDRKTFYRALQKQTGFRLIRGEISVDTLVAAKRYNDAATLMAQHNNWTLEQSDKVITMMAYDMGITNK